MFWALFSKIVRFLHNYTRFMVIFPEFRGAATLFLAENTVEVAQVIEAAAVADLRYRMRTVDEHPTGIPQSHVDDVIRQVTARMQFEEAAEGTGTHARYICHISQTDIIHIVLIDIVLHLQHPSAVAGHLHLREAAGG